jgi:hypothetical protein
MTVILEPACRDRLKMAVTTVIQDYHRLEAVVSVPVSQRDNTSTGKPVSKPPWNAAAANLIFELRHDARLEEHRLRVHLNLPLRARGSSDVNTLKALETVISLAEAAGTDSAASAASWLERWHGKAARVLGDASPVNRLPRQPGEKERPCPFCSCLTLRFWQFEGRVRCINPGCRDDEGRRPSAVIEYSAFTEQLELRWMDGILGLPAEAS